jgi:predicted adenine nucleotide alpha hydrolase (AANH) superfamily ATPase
MKVLLHSCCGPCTVYPLKSLRQEGFEVEGYFYNPNIHPYKEFLARLESYQRFASLQDLNTHIHSEYGLETFINALKTNELSCQQRCPLCYRLRLEAAAQKAIDLAMDAFTTTLLVSPYQNHELLMEIGTEIGTAKGIPFLQRDFRPGFRAAQQEARAMGLYIQAYCGCVFSEYDRYKPKVKKKVEK